MLATALLLPVAFITLIAMAGIVPAPGRHWIRRAGSVLAPVAMLPAAAAAVGGSPEPWEVPWLLFGSNFALDEVVRPLLLVTALLYGSALVAVAWVRPGDREPRVAALSAFLLACYTGNIGVYLASDTVAFYLAFAVMSFSAAGLVIHYRTRQARRATVIYLIMSVISETSLLAGMMLVVHAGGGQLVDAPQAVLDSPYTGLTLTLLFIGFSIKAGTLPLHVWLPLAHPAAPPAASAVLSGAMVKAGLVGWLRFFPTTADPLGEDAVTTLARVLLTLSLLGTFLAVPLGVLQNNPKVILAYSTISQMGFIGAVVAAGILVPVAAPATTAAAVLYAVHHGFVKGSLFLGVPVLRHFGRGAIGVVVIAGLLWASLSVAGAPGTSGAFAKYVSKEATADVTVLGIGLDVLLPLVATGSTLLLMRFAWVMWREERTPRPVPDGEFGAWVLLCLTGLTVPQWVGSNCLPLDPPIWGPGTLWDMIWPITLGLLPGLVVWWLAARQRLPGWFPAADGSLAPPGDLVVVEERGVLRALGAGTRALTVVHTGARRAAGIGTTAVRGAGDRIQHAIVASEAWVREWRGAGWAILLLLGGVAALVALSAPSLLTGEWF